MADFTGDISSSQTLNIDLNTLTVHTAALDRNTTYYFRAYAENTIGSAWAPASESFTTLTATVPAVVNLPAELVGAYSAWLGGEITDTGNDPPLVVAAPWAAGPGQT